MKNKYYLLTNGCSYFYIYILSRNLGYPFSINRYGLYNGKCKENILISTVYKNTFYMILFLL